MANPQEGDYEIEMIPEPDICNDFEYPSYDYVSTELLKFDTQLYAEYGESHHNYLKIMWENIEDMSIIKTVGDNIYHMGGYTALQSNYYAFLHVMRLAVRGTVNKYRGSFIDNKNTISRNWDGIGEWTH